MSRREYWGCEMESKMYREVVKEMNEKRAAMLRKAKGEERVEDVVKSKRGKRSKR